MPVPHPPYAQPSRTRRVLVAAVASLAVVAPAVVVASGSPAQAAAPTQYGKVTFVDDGDTIDVDVIGDGTRRAARIRFIGVQAMELRVYSRTLSKLRGECWAIAATRYLHSLVAGKQVQLTALHSGSRAGARARRSVAVQVNGVWSDTGQLLIDAGLALPDLISSEWAHNRDYLQGAKSAAARRVGMWGDPSRCGAGPAADASLAVHVHWDAAGNDFRNVNGEWVDIRNTGARTVSLAGWWLRDAAYRGPKARGYTFPRGTTIAAGQRLRLKVGKGARSAHVQHWGLKAPAFANVTGAPSWMGDGAWLFDRDGDLRAWNMYPT
jgi:micrococcal nuclease